MKPRNRLIEFANSSFAFWTCFWWREGGGMMTTLLRRPRTISPEEPFLLGIYSTFVMLDHFIQSPDLLVEFANSTLGFRRAFCKNSGQALFGDDHDNVSGRHPEQYLHTLPHTHHIPLKNKPSYAEVSALGPASPSHVQMASLFLMFGRCCASGFRSVETFLAAPAFCTIFTAFSYYPTTCGLAAASPSSFAIPTTVASFGA